MALAAKNLPANAGDIRDVVQSLGQEDPLQEGMATHSSIFFFFTEKIHFFSGYFQFLLLCGEFCPAAVCRPLAAAASSAVGHRVQAHGFSRCGSRAPEGRLCGYGTRAQLLRSTWDPPGLRDPTCVSCIGWHILHH